MAVDYEKLGEAENLTENPRKNANLFSILSFWWVKNILVLGNKRPLEIDDFSPLLEEDQTRGLTAILGQKWNEERTKNILDDHHTKHRLLKASMKMFSFCEKVFVVSTALFAAVVHVLGPVFLSLLLSEMMKPSSPGFEMAYLYAAGICASSFLRVLAENQYRFEGALMSMRWKSALIGLVYTKVLQLNQAKFTNLSSGYLLSLVSSDIQRFEWTILNCLITVQSLLEVVVIPCVIAYLFGWSALPGVLVLLIIGLINIHLCQKCAILRDKIAKVTDKRLTLTNSLVAGIRSVKIYAWELPFTERVQRIRRREISLIRWKFVLLAFYFSFYVSANLVASCASLATMAATGTDLTAYNVFIVVSLIGTMHSAFCRNIAWTARLLADTIPGLNRVQAFLEDRDTEEHSFRRREDEEQMPADTPKQLNRKKSSTLSKHDDYVEKALVPEEEIGVNRYGEVTFSEVDSRWNSNADKPTLKGISLTVQTGELVAIAGPVGCGKSSLLLAILEEIPSQAGRISCTGRLAYVPQIPWVFSGTVRDNILFGQPFDSDRYQQVLQACDLKKDLQSFPAEDFTHLGERGITLSGGQRARIGLARAVYQDAELYLLDDPFSAVDTKVAKHLFRECVKGLLGRKTRLMVTHSRQFLKDAHHIVIMKDGEILQQGNYEELVDAGAEIAHDEINALKPRKTLLSLEESTMNSSILPDLVDLDVEDEDRLSGLVSRGLYWSYFRAGLHIVPMISLAVFILVAQGSLMAPDLWLLKITSLPRDQRGTVYNFAIYGGLVGGAFVLPAARGALWLFALLKSSQILHERMMSAILKAPVIFFDTNPVGRILNRFSRDIGVLDEVLPGYFLNAVQIIAFTISVVLLDSILNPWIVFGAIPLMVAFILIGRYYSKTSNELQRLEALSRSSVLAHLSDTLEGLVTIRSYNRKHDFLQELFRYQDRQNQTWYWLAATLRWLSFNLDISSVMFTALVVFLAIATHSGPGITALSLVYALQLAVDNCQVGVQMFSQVENYMTSVERVLAYTQIEQEPGYNSSQSPPENWPERGEIKVDKMSLVYYKGGPTVFRDISFTINPGEKIGVVGRTGAGKSSLVAALFRMPEPTGQVIIDGISLGSLNIQSSRRAMSVITQNPVLFSGTVRTNLDPFEERQEKEIWEALDQANLKGAVENLPEKLSHEIRECGGNFSVGERQLLCLARCLLQKKQVVIMDEATANVDYKTDQLIQETIRTKFRDCTVITVAHRLNTILDYDRVLVLDQGKVVEFDKPERLLEKEGGIFLDMYHQLLLTSDK